jgi:hypothetical protein
MLSFTAPQIRDLHVAKRTEDIGFYAGFVGLFVNWSFKFVVV